MSVKLPKDTPQVKGLTVGAEVVAVRTHEVVALITVNSRNRQLPCWFTQAATEVNPLLCERLGSQGGRKTQMKVTINTKGSLSPEHAVVAYLTGTLRKVEARYIAKVTAPRAMPEQRTTRVRRSTTSSPRLAHRRLAFS